jgi:heterodisulfide reductase subunit A
MDNHKPRIGVYVCECGINIGSVVDVEKVVRFAQGLPNVVIARPHRYTCSEAGQEMIKRDIRESHLNRVVVASCSPRMHEGTFQGAVASAGLNPYFFQMANIREHVSWVVRDPTRATPAAMVVGAGIAGIQAALTLADAGYPVYLVERQPAIGGRMAQLDKTFPTLDCST